MVACDPCSRLSGRNGDKLNHSGSGFGRRVDKEHRFGVGNVFGQFRRPLRAGYDADAGLEAESLQGPFGQVWAKAIVAAQRVATGENQTANAVGRHG